MRTISDTLAGALARSLLASFAFPIAGGYSSTPARKGLFGWIYLGIAVGCTLLAGITFGIAHEHELKRTVLRKLLHNFLEK